MVPVADSGMVSYRPRTGQQSDLSTVNPCTPKQGSLVFRGLLTKELVHGIKCLVLTQHLHEDGFNHGKGSQTLALLPPSKDAENVLG